MPLLLVDSGTGRLVRVGPAFSIRGPAFSGDGTRAAWLSEWWSERPELTIADLQAERPQASAVPVPVPPGRIADVALSADGRMAAVVQAQQVTVFPVGSAQPAVVAPTPKAGWWRRAMFSRDGRVHVLAGGAETSGLDVLLLDPATGRTSVTGHVASRGDASEHWGPEARRLAVIHRADHRPSLTLHDGTSGALLGTLVPEGLAGRVAATFLQDGRLAVVETRDGVRLHVFTADGAETASSVTVAPAFALADVSEVAPGIVAVGLPSPYPVPVVATETVLIDASSGRILRREPGVGPARMWWLAGGMGEALPSAPANLFIDREGRLVRLDLESGARQAVLGAR